MKDKFILISLEDAETKKFAKVLGNESCKKIMKFLTETKEASEKDLADALDMPINTVEYNLKKLMDAKFIEKTKNFFWSKKGRKIDMYKLSNKSIVISPKNSNVHSKLKSLLPVAMLTAVSTFAVYVFEKIRIASDIAVQNSGNTVPSLAKGLYESAAPGIVADEGVRTIITQQVPFLWLWFLSGALLVILILTILNWRKL